MEMNYAPGRGVHAPPREPIGVRRESAAIEKAYGRAFGLERARHGRDNGLVDRGSHDSRRPSLGRDSIDGGYDERRGPPRGSSSRSARDQEEPPSSTRARKRGTKEMRKASAGEMAKREASSDADNGWAKPSLPLGFEDGRGRRGRR